MFRVNPISADWLIRNMSGRRIPALRTHFSLCGLRLKVPHPNQVVCRSC